MADLQYRVDGNVGIFKNKVDPAGGPTHFLCEFGDGEAAFSDGFFNDLPSVFHVVKVEKGLRMNGFSIDKLNAHIILIYEKSG